MTLSAHKWADRVFSEELERKLLEHQGKWVGIADDEIVAIGDTPAEVLRLAELAGHPEVLLHCVPEHGKAYFF